MKFTTVLQGEGKTVGIDVPESVVLALGSGKRPPVAVTLRGHTYRSTIAVMGGRYMIAVNAPARAATGVQAGDKVEVAVELDTESRAMPVPPDMAAALAADAAALSRFNALSDSRRNALILPVEQAKTEDTRRRRIDKAVQALGPDGSP